MCAAALQAHFGKPPLADMNPDEVVALGAAIQADQLAGNASAGGEHLLLDVIPLCRSGWRRWVGWSKRSFRATRPSGRQGAGVHHLRTARPRWRCMWCRASDELVADCRSLARFELRGIPPMVAWARAHPGDISGGRRWSGCR